MHENRLETTTILFFLTAAVLALLLVACGDSGTTTASDEPTTTASTPTTAAPTPTVEVVTAGDAQIVCPTEGDEWEVAKLYIEHNATDEDTGVHGLFGGEAWQELCITDPDGNQIFLADPQAQLHDLAVSDFFFESREPEAAADLTSLAVPVEFLLPDTIYELEVLALEDSGNQAISVGFFRTAA